MINTVFAFLLALGILVIFHEWGHYAVARFFNVRVIRFSVGFGRPLIKKQFTPGGTEWVLALIPFGGYVRMVDERDPESLNVPNLNLDEAFNRKPVLQRMAVVLAGPVMNLLLAIFFYAVVQFVGYGEPGSRVAQPAAHTFAAALGLEHGDEIVAINQRPVSGWTDINWQMMRSVLSDDEIHVQVIRQGAQHPLQLSKANAGWPELSPSALTNLGMAPYEGTVVLRKVLEGSAGEKGGLRAGDRIVTLNGNPVISSGTLSQAIRVSAGQPMTVGIERDSKPMQLVITPETVLPPSGGASYGKVGIAMGGNIEILRNSKGALDSFLFGARHTWEVSTFSLAAFGKMITGQMSLKMLSGPVSIADAAGQSAKVGIIAYIGFLAMVSVSLGVLNLLPVPLLDGGHLMYYLAEFVRGKPLPDVWFEWGQRFGIALIGAMTVLALFNDVQRML